jgi:hypothetical protein
LGSVTSALGVGSVGVNSPGADGSGAGITVAGSEGVDSPGADGSGAGTAVASFDLRGAVHADLMKSGQLHQCKSKRAECPL